MIKLITHTDLDGVSNAILAVLSYGNYDIDISYCNYDNVDTVALEVLDNSGKYEQIIITDISVSDETAQKLNQISNKLVLLDHHPTALYLNKYDWCKVEIEYNGEKTCGTSMFLRYLIDNNKINTNIDMYEISDIFEYTEMVRKYDTWLWQEKYNDTKPRDLNNLFYLYGRDRFIDRTVIQLRKYGFFSFTTEDELLLELDNERKEKYIEDKNKDLIVKNIQGYKVGVVFAEQYISELGNQLARLREELDFIVMISDKTISYRGIKNDINLGEIAKIYGGGGHPKASGNSISEKNRELYLNLLFNI